MALLLFAVAAPADASAARARPSTVAAGESQSCAVSATGGVTCWGSRSGGSLGDGATRGNSFNPVAVGSLGAGVTDRWLTEDRCNGTFFRVTQGVIAVRAFRLGRTVTVRAGRSFLAPARRR